MQQSSRDAARCLREAGATACTDVTGFGLVGHLVEMLRASRVDAALFAHAIPALEGALETLGAGISSSLAPENLRQRRAIRDLAAAARLPAFPLLFDPQTAGGLLASVPASQAEACLAELRGLGYERAAIVGEVLEASESEPRIIVSDAGPHYKRPPSRTVKSEVA
jgi:selenide,water dikinase